MTVAAACFFFHRTVSPRCGFLEMTIGFTRHKFVKMVLLKMNHVRKTQKTPISDLRLARNRLKELQK